MTALPRRIRTFPNDSERHVLEAIKRLYAAPRRGCLVTLAEVAACTDASTSHAFRQCTRLVELGLLARVGAGSHARYVLPAGVPDQKAWEVVQSYIAGNPASPLASAFSSVYQEVCYG